MTGAVEELSPTGESVLFDDRVFQGFFALVGVLMVAGLVLFVFLLVRNARVGLGPGAPSRTGMPLAQRLQELDDLHRRGVISDAEHAQARQHALTSP